MIPSWGKPRVIAQLIGNDEAPYIEFYTPVENSTQLSTTKGDKKEAKIEGGEVEAVKYNKNTYSLALQIRIGVESGTTIRKKPIVDADGVIDGEYRLWVQPETPNGLGMHMETCHISVEDAFTSEDGILLTYTFDALKANGRDQVEWGTVEITGEYLKPTAVKFTEKAEAA
ncbi:MAG: hypothetical protein NC095_06260 [Muribaculum sp.]|nr:hypothetical protein [Muribaculum sp.]